MSGEQGGFGFLWVYHNGPEAPRRRNIRSWVTSFQHSRQGHIPSQRVRKVSAREEVVAPPTPESSSSDSTIGSGSPTAGRCRKRAAESPDPPACSSARSPPLPRKVVKRTDSEANPLLTDCEYHVKRVTTPSASALGLDSPAVLLANAFEDPTDPLRLYAVQLGIQASALWSHYLWQEREHGHLFRTQYGQFGNLAPKFLHPKILNDPAMLSTTVLFSASHWRYMRGMKVMSSDILRIKSMAYGFVQAAIDDQTLQLDDSTFLAIIKLALWEVVFGQHSAYRVHMLGLLEMICLRGGLRNLGPGGYVGHILRWFDANLSAVAGIPPFLAEEAAVAGMKDLDPNPEPFVLGVRLLEKSTDDGG